VNGDRYKDIDEKEITIVDENKVNSNFDNIHKDSVITDLH
jgi:hypothetical protein